MMRHLLAILILTISLLGCAVISSAESKNGQEIREKVLRKGADKMIKSGVSLSSITRIQDNKPKVRELKSVSDMKKYLDEQQIYGKDRKKIIKRTRKVLKSSSSSSSSSSGSKSSSREQHNGHRHHHHHRKH